jgi:hypothetical protein
MESHWASVRNVVGTVFGALAEGRDQDPVVFGRRRGGHIDREMIM